MDNYWVICSSCAIPPRVAGGLWSDELGCDAWLLSFGVLVVGVAEVGVELVFFDFRGGARIKVIPVGMGSLSAFRSCSSAMSSSLALSRDHHSAHAFINLCLTHRAFCGPVCCHRSRGERGVAVRAGGKVPAGHVEDVALLVQADGAQDSVGELLLGRALLLLHLLQRHLMLRLGAGECGQPRRRSRQRREDDDKDDEEDDDEDDDEEEEEEEDTAEALRLEAAAAEGCSRRSTCPLSTSSTSTLAASSSCATRTSSAEIRTKSATAFSSSSWTRRRARASSRSRSSRVCSSGGGGGGGGGGGSVESAPACDSEHFEEGRLKVVADEVRDGRLGIRRGRESDELRGGGRVVKCRRHRGVQGHSARSASTSRAANWPSPLPAAR